MPPSMPSGLNPGLPRRGEAYEGDGDGASKANNLLPNPVGAQSTKEAIPMPGFIQDKLEIKFLILYIAARVEEPVPFDTILDLTLCDDAIDYFDFSDCLADLVRTEHLTLSDSGLYALTDKGRRNGAACESSLPYSVRQRCDKNLEEWNRKLRRQRQVKASYEPRPNGTYTVRLQLSDDKGGVMDLKVMMVDQAQAKAVAKRFREAPEQLYGQIVHLLLPPSGE